MVKVIDTALHTFATINKGQTAVERSRRGRGTEQSLFSRRKNHLQTHGLCGRRVCLSFGGHTQGSEGNHQPAHDAHSQRHTSGHICRKYTEQGRAPHVVLGAGDTDGQHHQCHQCVPPLSSPPRAAQVLERQVPGAVRPLLVSEREEVAGMGAGRGRDA